MLIRDDHVLLTQRRGGYGGGMWHLPSGKLDAGESIEHAVVREAHEEVGVLVTLEALEFVHLAHVHGSGPEPRIGVFFAAHTWVGEPTNREPDKCSALAWCPLNDLPADVIPYPLAGIQAYRTGRRHSVLGWTDLTPVVSARG
ncbi:NUDIX domain-containing protein [Allokutzneria sp. A3M-2-11 16]|uniref:NUDIX hydrolase n=1 Tax=Allokutzneria sp. A3M-2-11 16 TaxID=2962043 RepID=UPI0020B8C1A5|nr:NUDIX domain-containing protein [Allokutzneria sp. A3M-2-11 16]MCP3801876.1 NUDIX domain-containing protein [Allokutzneria sp. A3M-2-11 16]